MSQRIRNKVWLLALVCLLGLGACTTVPVTPAPKKVSSAEEQAAIFTRAKALFHARQYEEAAALMLALARRGHLEAQYALGYMYYYGYGVPRNEKEALRWIGAAAARGHPKAGQALEVLEGKVPQKPAP